MLTIADEGGRGGLKTPNLADVICEQPLISLIIYLWVDRSLVFLESLKHIGQLLNNKELAFRATMAVIIKSFVVSPSRPFLSDPGKPGVR